MTKGELLTDFFVLGGCVDGRLSPARTWFRMIEGQVMSIESLLQRGSSVRVLRLRATTPQRLHKSLRASQLVGPGSELYGRISIGVPFGTSFQISSISLSVTGMQPRVQSRLKSSAVTLFVPFGQPWI